MKKDDVSVESGGESSREGSQPRETAVDNADSRETGSFTNSNNDHAKSTEEDCPNEKGAGGGGADSPLASPKEEINSEVSTQVGAVRVQSMPSPLHKGLRFSSKTNKGLHQSTDPTTSGTHAHGSAPLRGLRKNILVSTNPSDDPKVVEDTMPPRPSFLGLSRIRKDNGDNMSGNQEIGRSSYEAMPPLRGLQKNAPRHRTSGAESSCFADAGLEEEVVVRAETEYTIEPTVATNAEHTTTTAHGTNGEPVTGASNLLATWEEPAIIDSDEEETEPHLHPGDGSFINYETGSALQAPPLTDNHNHVDDVELAAARLVPASEWNLSAEAHAVEVNLKELEQKKERKKRENRNLKMAGGLTLVCCVAIILVLSITLPRKKGTNSIVVPVSTVAPSQSPSSAPTGILDVFVSSLPTATQDSLQDPTTAQFLALDWLTAYPDVASLERWRQTQLFALATFYYAFEGPNWPAKIRNDWLLYDKEECNWFASGFGQFDSSGRFWQFETIFGSEFLEPCNGEGEFQSIQLPGLNLSLHKPYFPPELDLLTSLRQIDLPDSNINASLAEFLLPLTKVSSVESFKMDGNQLYGTIPSEIGIMVNLQTLVLGGYPVDAGSGFAQYFASACSYDWKCIWRAYLDTLPNNFLDGTLPTEIGLLSNLQFLALANSQLSGTIPTEIGKLSNVLGMDLVSNLLDGRVPTEIGLMTGLEVLSLRFNFLSGSLVSEIGAVQGMRSLDFSINDFSGTIPSEIYTLGNMTSFSAISCSLTGSITTDVASLKKLAFWSLLGNYLTGRLPTELGILTDMELFSADNNILSGTIPELSWPNLHWLGLSNNMLSGSLPVEFFSSLTNIVSLDLGGNRLSSTLPTEVGLLSNMTVLSLFSNAFEGAIPSSVGQLTQLESANLFGLNFSHTLPSQLGLLTKMTAFMLTDTSITGTIPSELGMMTRMNNLLLQDSYLSMQIPTELFEMSQLKVLYLDRHKLQGTLSTELGRLTKLEGLQISGNLLTGVLPSEIGLLTSLSTLFLEENSLSGSLPGTFGELRNLETLALHKNNLSGPMPTELGLLRGLRELSLYSSFLTGFPTELGLLESMYYFDLEYNPLFSVLPTQLGLLQNLEVVYLSECGLFGTLPQEMATNLSNLKLLSLGFNSITGHMPSELGLWTQLTSLVLANNSLSGSLPSELGLLNSSLATLDIGNNSNLEGRVPDTLCSLEDALQFTCQPSSLCGCNCTCAVSFYETAGNNATNGTA